MAKNKGRFLIDDSISSKDREEIVEKVNGFLDKTKDEIAERQPIIEKRQDFFEGRHHKWTNVVGQLVKQQEGHILAVFNYILKMCQKVHQTLTNTPPKIKIQAKDESNEIETARAERVEEAVYQVLESAENDFFKIVFPRCALNQIRDGDFTFECKVMEEKGVKRIVITPNEDLLKVVIGWDDASGSSFSWAVFSDLWATSKILRDFGYEAEAETEAPTKSTQQGDHLSDQFGIFANQSAGAKSTVPSGKVSVPRARVTDYWGYELIKGEMKVVNLIFINKENVQFIVTDYKRIPRFVGHSFVVAGKPYSMGFIDPLMDPQIELNDRSSEEGDLVRVGSHMKFLVVNMPDFDPDSIKPGSGQCIFIEGENADFRPLTMNISPFPSGDYVNRVMEHLFNIGLPKIALAAGTAPYTGRVGAIQYQPFEDLIGAFRIQWEIVMRQLVRTIQEYLIAYFPESLPFMRESIYDDVTQTASDGDPIIRDVEFDWENVLPLSRSDKVIDASNLRDRGAISLSTYLEEAGFKYPQKEIKKLKKEAKDAELMTLMSKFQQFSPGVVKASLEAQMASQKAQEANAQTAADTAAATPPATATPASTPPIMNSSQNSGRRGVYSAAGTPNGQTATPAGAVAQATQNLNAQGGA